MLPIVAVTVVVPTAEAVATPAELTVMELAVVELAAPQAACELVEDAGPGLHVTQDEEEVPDVHEERVAVVPSL